MLTGLIPTVDSLVDVGCNIGQYSLAVAALGRQVVAVDADANNLELIRKSLELINRLDSTKLIYNSVSDGYETLYPYTPKPTNPGATFMKTWQEVQEEGLNITLVTITNRIIMIMMIILACC